MKKDKKGSRIMRSFVFAGMLLGSMPFSGNAAPTFVHGSTQTISVCQNSGPSSFGTALNITDTTTGVAETWYVISGPTNGTVTGFPFASASVGGVLTTAGSSITYQPFSGFSGSDIITVGDSDQFGNRTVTQITIVVTPLPSLVLGTPVAVCQGASSTTLPFTSLANVGPTSTTFFHMPGILTGALANGGGIDSFVVPPGVENIVFDVQGGVGGSDDHSGAPNPGNGGRVQGTLAVSGGEILYVYTGGQGGNGSTAGASGGFNGGGNATYYFFGCGGAGGGASDIRVNDMNLSSRVVVAGGGGGNGWDSPGPEAGGVGGNLTGGTSANNVGGSHAGGGVTSGSLAIGGAQATYTGWTPGGNGGVGFGGNGSTQGISGGGGGGFAGGGGGVWTGGGGGSSYASPGLVSTPVFTSGYNIGTGIVSFNYNIPGTYDVYWDTSMYPGVAFVDAVGLVMPSSSPITLALPSSAPAGTYNGQLVIHNGTCSSTSYPFTVTVNPIPSVSVTPSTQTICNGDTTTAIYMAGSDSLATYNWTNSAPSIGLIASGSGNISSFTGINSGSVPVTADITVTPVALSCSGTPVDVTVVVNPTPSLTSTLSPLAICDSTAFGYLPTSATAGTTFTWYRGTVYGIVDSAASGSNSPGEYLYNNIPETVVVPYSYVLAANGCLNTQIVNATINPRPMLTTTVASPICNNSTFNFTPASATFGTSFAWNRNTVPGISNAAATGSDNPMETLTNTTTDSVVVPYLFTLTANSCTYAQTVAVTVYPSPTLTSTATTPVCNDSSFTFAASSATPGTSYSWTRNSIPGISNPSVTVTSNTISENLLNTTAHPVTVTYNYMLTANSCSNNQPVSVVVYPTPSLTTSLAPTICDSLLLGYVPASATSGTTFTWSRDTVTGISNAAATGTNGPNETLVNTTTHNVIANYIYTLSANGCYNNETVAVTVFPRPKLNSTLAPTAVCDSGTFSYAPTSLTAGTSYSWYRPYIAGIYAVAQSGSGNINQQLINSTYVPIDVTYNFTITANGCTNTENVIVAVNPTPRLNPPYTATVCSGSPFMYTPTSYTPGALYAWNRPAVSHVGPATSFAGTGNGVINETLTDSVLVPEVVSYIYRLSVNGCPNLYTQTVRLTVNPTPQVPSIVIAPGTFACSQTMYQNFGAATPQASNVMYEWSVTNGAIAATSKDNQNILVNFTNPGLAVITLRSNVSGFNCYSSSNYYVNVSGGSSEVNPTVIYYNGQFICLANSGVTYQWGYDNVSTLMSTVLNGQIDQDYTNDNPDFTDNLYWCMTTSSEGCIQKSYYNAPSAVSNVEGGSVSLNVFPNPTNELLNVELQTNLSGKITVEVLNVMGQRLMSQVLENNRGTLNVAGMASGAYLLECYRDGAKIATTRFIKN